MHVTILGCGQLARLMALAGKSMGVEFTFVAIDNEDTRCVENFGNIVHWSTQVTTNALLQTIGKTDVITVEREDIDTSLLVELSLNINVHPRPEIVSICKNRLQEKLALTQLNIATTPWLSVTSKQGMENAVDCFDYPLVVKSVEQGYDGKNQWRVTNGKELDKLISSVSKINWIVEPLIDFEREISLIGVRSLSGEIKFYSPTENSHVQGILRTSIAPADFMPQHWLSLAQQNLHALLEKWNYVGVLAMELFVTHTGLMVNELAPRVHNSGHWTENGCATSQFENHLRAVLDLPLGSTESQGFAAMVNILGNEFAQQDIVFPKASVQLYNKRARPGRKLGHINLVDQQRERLLHRVKSIEDRIYSE